MASGEDTTLTLLERRKLFRTWQGLLSDSSEERSFFH